MKKIVFVSLILMVFLTNKVGAIPIWDTPQAPLKSYQLIFLKVRNEYLLRYGVYGLPEGTVYVKPNFWTATGVYYTALWDNPTGSAYLTCNGTYIFQLLDANMQVIAETKKIITTKIKNPPCRSYENGQDKDIKNELNVRVDEDYMLWDYIEGASKYEIYRDGENLVGTNTNGIDTSWFIGNQPAGIYTVVALNSDNEVIGIGDYVYKGGGTEGVEKGEDAPQNGGGEGGTCDVCDMLKNALNCPYWDDYMGELSNAIRNALPPPPDWHNIASIFVGEFAGYFGSVPTVPTENQIENKIVPTLPPINDEIEDINLLIPEEFENSPLDTDITDGDVIVIVDESEAIDIYEPNEFIESDEVGRMVYPNDERNSSGGIKSPEIIDTGYPQPTPQPMPTNEPIPAEPIPTPQPIPAEPIPTPQPIPAEPMPTPQPIPAEPMPTPQPISVDQ